MKIRKKIIRNICAVLLAINMMVLPVCATEDIATYAEARWNNIAVATLTLSFDSNNVAHCGIVLSPYSHCTGFDGMMRLYDSSGAQLKSWAVYDHESPYDVENTWQCEEGKSYTVTFQGYAYGSGTMYDEINLSVTNTCD